MLVVETCPMLARLQDQAELASQSDKLKFLKLMVSAGLGRWPKLAWLLWKCNCAIAVDSTSARLRWHQHPTGLCDALLCAAPTVSLRPAPSLPVLIPSPLCPPPLQGGRTAAETLQQAGGSLPPPEPEEPYEPVFGPAAPWELEQQQQASQQQAAAASEGVEAEAGFAEMEVEGQAAAEADGPAAAGPLPVAGPPLEGAAAAGPANIMKREHCLRMGRCTVVCVWWRMHLLPRAAQQGFFAASLACPCLCSTLTHPCVACPPLHAPLPAGEGQQPVLMNLSHIGWP